MLYNIAFINLYNNLYNNGEQKEKFVLSAPKQPRGGCKTQFQTHVQAKSAQKY